MKALQKPLESESAVEDLEEDESLLLGQSPKLLCSIDEEKDFLLRSPMLTK